MNMIMRDAMGDLQDLELALTSTMDKLTVEEGNILRGWRAQAKKYSAVGFGFGSVLAFLFTYPPLPYPIRFNLSLGGGVACGFLGHRWSLESCIDRILGMDGSPMQREMATIMLKKYCNDPWTRPRLSKHFFTEEVYKDSSADKPIYRWRFRNVYGNPIVHSQNTFYSKETDFKLSTLFKPKQAYLDSTSYTFKNPLDIISWLMGSAEENPDPSHESSTASERKRRRENRRRKNEMRNEEDSDI